MCISGLGTFTFSKRRIDVGSNKFIVIQRPVFVLSEKFAQTHSLHYVKQHVSGWLHVHVLVQYTLLPMHVHAPSCCICDYVITCSFFTHRWFLNRSNPNTDHEFHGTLQWDRPVQGDGGGSTERGVAGTITLSGCQKDH